MKIGLKLVYFLFVFLAIHILIRHYQQSKIREEQLLQHLNNVNEQEHEQEDEIVDEHKVVDEDENLDVYNFKPEYEKNDYSSLLDDYFNTFNEKVYEDSLNKPSENDRKLSVQYQDLSQLQPIQQKEYNNLEDIHQSNQKMYDYRNTVPTKINVLPSDNKNVIVSSDSNEVVIEKMETRKTPEDQRNNGELLSYQMYYNNPYSDMQNVVQEHFENNVVDFDNKKQLPIQGQYDIKKDDIRYVPNQQVSSEILKPQTVPNKNNDLSQISNLQFDLLGDMNPSNLFQGYEKDSKYELL